MKALLNRLVHLLLDRSGNEFGEKAVITILVVVAGIGAWAAFGGKVFGS